MVIDKVVTEYKQKGFTVIKGLIDPQDVSKFVEIAKRYDSGMSNENISYFSSAVRFFDPRVYKHIYKPITPKLYQDSYFLISQTYRPKFKSLIDTLGFQGFRSISRIDSYVSYKSDKNIVGWHCDQAFGGATHPAEFFGGTSGIMSLNNVNKLFIHVKYQNGCFSYLPYSHKINIAIRKLINEGIVAYKPILLLQDAVNLVKGEYYNELLNVCSKESLENFIDSGEEALRSDKDFVLECKAGDAILFNDLGFHKGTAPQKSERIVFRYFY
ncbi:MAG TPA: hypothetical protein EYQ06_10105 [Flavobacteriales bacterium]|nr:hypothetical protein [Flavobacteriales bacterium]